MGKLTSDFRLASRMAIAVSLILLRQRQARRKMMFAISVVAMLLAFLGFTLLEGWLADHPLLFALYWFFCTGMVLFMLLLAIYDLAAVKGELNARSEREMAEILKEIGGRGRSGDADGEE